MAAVTAALVKELREMTGAGMMDCKKALVATEGGIDKAVDYLRENGLAKAAKKAGRIASEGLVRMAFAADGSAAAAVEVNSETDFVAKNEEFIEFVEKLADISLNAEKVCAECIKDMPYGEEGTVGEVLVAKIAKIGENMNIRRCVKCNTPGVKYVGYSHGGGRIGVIIGLKTDASVEEVTTCGKDVAMQAASMRPQFVDEASVDPEYLAHEKEVILAQAINENNELPENKSPEGSLPRRSGLRKGFQHDRGRICRFLRQGSRQGHQGRRDGPLRSRRRPCEEGRELRRGSRQADPRLISNTDRNLELPAYCREFLHTFG